MKHTPGPWKIGNYGKILTANGDMLHVSGVSLPMGGYADRESEFEANARLIAAAPELLAALQTALPFLAKLSADSESQIAKRIFEKADAAIRKAEEGQ